MAKRVRDIEPSERTTKTWREAELIKAFKLNCIIAEKTSLMKEWLDVQSPKLNVAEQYYFDKVSVRAQRNIRGWSEEDLKIKFIGLILELGNFNEEGEAIGYFDKIISATVDGIRLSVKSDFMLAKGLLDVFETPYFHFQ